jgi:hypothetical protein
MEILCRRKSVVAAYKHGAVKSHVDRRSKHCIGSPSHKTENAIHLASVQAPAPASEMMRKRDIPSAHIEEIGKTCKKMNVFIFPDFPSVQIAKIVSLKFPVISTIRVESEGRWNLIIPAIQLIKIIVKKERIATYGNLIAELCKIHALKRNAVANEVATLAFMQIFKSLVLC